MDNESYVRAKLVKERVYDILKENTSINFLNNRRKPSRNDFNQYYTLLKTNLKDESFTNVELFNELAVYFSDNLFNMFKLLDNNWRNLIINGFRSKAPCEDMERKPPALPQKIIILYHP
jgi:hypothetical protein